MFFKDAALRNRPMRLTAQLAKGGMLDVVKVQSYIKDKLHDVYYWCDNCALGYSEPGECLCRGGKVTLVEAAVTDKPLKMNLLVPR
jgi:hypothetical protein